MLNAYIQDLLDRYVEGDAARFGELWMSMPSLAADIAREIEKQQSWVFLRPETYDGWYLVKNLGQYNLYYQERGQRCWGNKEFTEESAALTALLVSSGALNKKA